LGDLGNKYRLISRFQAPAIQHQSPAGNPPYHWLLQPMKKFSYIFQCTTADRHGRRRQQVNRQRARPDLAAAWPDIDIPAGPTSLQNPADSFRCEFDICPRAG
jgi:hypothetical protein